MKDISRHAHNPSINDELIASFYSHAIFGMMVEWIKGGFKYSSGYMAEQLLMIVNSEAA